MPGPGKRGRPRKDPNAPTRVGQNGTRSQGPASGIPAHGVYEPFADGNQVGFIHGAGSDRSVFPSRMNKGPGQGPTPAVLKLAGEIRELLKSDDYPEWLLYPKFSAEVESWLLRQARALILSDWLETIPVDQWSIPQRTGSQTTPYDQWAKADEMAARSRQRLGLSPASYAGILRDLGLADRAREDGLASMGATGERIRASREAQLRIVRGEVEGGAEGGGEREQPA